jgi:hypothetical protein
MRSLGMSVSSIWSLIFIRWAGLGYVWRGWDHECEC